MLARTEPLRRGPRRQGCDTEKWRLRKAGRFSYGESPQTPPLEGTSLRRWNKSVERPWGILSLFTTCLWLQVKSPWGNFTDKTRVLRDPGGSSACLPPAYDYGWNHPATGCDTCQLRQEKNWEKKGAIWNVKRTRTVKEQLDRRCRKTRLKMKPPRTDETY